MLNIKYFSPSDFKIIYVEDGKWILMDDKGNKSPTSEYYPSSQHWNGDSPFFPVDYEAEFDSYLVDEQAVHWLLFYNVRRFADSISMKRNSYMKLAGANLQKEAVDEMKTILNTYCDYYA